jgi:hypothetical protein
MASNQQILNAVTAMCLASRQLMEADLELMRAKGSLQRAMKQSVIATVTKKSAKTKPEIVAAREYVDQCSTALINAHKLVEAKTAEVLRLSAELPEPRPS